MRILLIQHTLEPNQYAQLLLEFPHYEILVDHDHKFPSLDEEKAERVEILYGTHLDTEHLSQFSQLHWIHNPTPYVDNLCLKDIQKKENIIISTTREEHLPQIGEFALAILLGSAKQLNRWSLLSHKQGGGPPSDSMWTAKNCTVLIIGLGALGTEIAKKAKEAGFHVWGVSEEASFHPHCEKTFHFEDLHSLLPTVEVVCLTLPRFVQFHPWFAKKEFELMQKESQLMVFGTGSVLHLEDLFDVAKEGKFRSIWIDAHFSNPIAKNSPLRKLPQVTITPEISPYPLGRDDQGFRNFLFNLRQYQYSNFKDMKNLIPLSMKT